MFDGHYLEWNKNRLNVINKHFENKFFRDKSLLDVGCGHGFFSREFRKIGADVTCSDARKEYLENLKDFKVIHHDLDQVWTLGKFDIILHFGVLYHLKDPKQALKFAIENSKTLILETEVLNSSHDLITLRNEEGYDQAYGGIGNQISVGAIEIILQDSGKFFKRIDDSDLNSSFHHYDWEVKDESSPMIVSGRRKFWIVGEI